MVVFSMHGMGPNTNDVCSMVLLPELLYRSATGTSRFHSPAPEDDPAPAMETSWDLDVIDGFGQWGRPSIA